MIDLPRPYVQSISDFANMLHRRVVHYVDTWITNKVCDLLHNDSMRKFQESGNSLLAGQYLKDHGITVLYFDLSRYDDTEYTYQLSLLHNGRIVGTLLMMPRDHKGIFEYMIDEVQDLEKIPVVIDES